MAVIAKCSSGINYTEGVNCIKGRSIVGSGAFGARECSDALQENKVW